MQKQKNNQKIKKTNNKLSWKMIWAEHRSLVLGCIFVIFVAILTTLGQSQWFKSSLMEVSNPFDGTIFPIDLSPDYTKWKGNVKTDTFNSIKSILLKKLPDYEDALKNISGDELLDNPKVQNAKITYPVVYLGTYENDFQENKGSHLAVDIRVPVGTPVRAIANGVVSKVDMGDSGFGHHICIKHSNVPEYPDTSKKTILYSCYNHMDKIVVSQGEFIFKGAQIGTSGNTGTSTTPHLHFQIDNSNAPWHPYWPFSWAEASAASLTFFDAVSTGLNKDQAAQMTVNPMKWVAANYSEANIGNNLTASTSNEVTHQSASKEDSKKDNSDDLKAQILKSFIIASSKNTFDTKESVNITIIAKNENGDTIKDYRPSSGLEVSSSSGSAEFKKVLEFENGEAKLTVKNPVSKNFNIKVKEGETSGTIDLKTESSETKVETTNTEEVIEESDKMKVTDVIFSGESSVMKEATVSFYAELKNKDGDTINELDENIPIMVEGKGSVSPSSISSNDIKDGKVTLNYKSNEVETAKITIIDKSFEIKVIDAIKETTAFKVYNDNNDFVPGEETVVYIKSIDSDGNETPSYTVRGNVKISFIDGKGTIKPEELTSNDFKGGKAEIKIKTDGNIDFVKLKAQNGAIIGKSETFNKKQEEKIEITEESNESIFTDVKTNHKNATAIKYLKENNIIGGYSDGSFKPDKQVSRIEALKMLLLGLNKGLEPSKTVNFPDTEANSWYTPYIGRALELGMVKGYPDGSFKPSNSVNRAEYYKILISASGIEVETFHGAPFNDVPEGTWFTDYVGYAKENGITENTNNFEPNGNVTRAEVAETLYRVLNLK